MSEEAGEKRRGQSAGDGGGPDTPPPPPVDGQEERPTSVRESNPLIGYVRRTSERVRIVLPQLQLTVEREGGRQSGRVVVVDANVCRIGANFSNDLVLEDELVSRFHCRIVREGPSWRIYDTGSRNGTALDGLVVGEAELPNECRLALGDSVVRVTATEERSGVAVPAGSAFGQLLGLSDSMRRLFALLERIAASDIDVLVEGESGTGKELVAREVVRRSRRKDRPFVVVDCGAISPSLVESELFGHARGAFTGADRDRVGAFEAADGGTVFLDEIGELPRDLQPKLLRALEQREFRRVGETRPRTVDVRVLAATHRDLEREVNQQMFREDLYFRLAKVCVRVPPLRERLEDVPQLVHHFLETAGRPEAEGLFSPAVLRDMQSHAWPGNVRELRNFVERSVVLGSVVLGRRHSSMPASGPRPMVGAESPIVPFRQAKEAAVETFERAYLGDLLRRSDGNLSRAARTAAMDRTHLHQLAQKYGLRDPDARGKRG